MTGQGKTQRWKNVPEHEVEAHYEKLKKTRFPVPKYNKREAEHEIKSFHRYAQGYKGHLDNEDKINRSFFGSKIVRAYHPHRYSERTEVADSLAQAWKKPERLKRGIKLTIADGKAPTRENVGKTFIRYDLGMSPTHFFPAQSLAVMHRYTKPGDKVLDPFMGYGGSMPAAAASGRKFVGIDLNPKSVKGDKKMAADLQKTLKLRKDHIRIHHGDTRRVMKRMKPNSVDLVYTSPPYFNREKYSGKGQSHEAENYHSWLSDFYVPVLENMHRVVKPNGKVVINIAPLRKSGKVTHQLDDHTVELAKHMGFKLVEKKRLVLGGVGNNKAGKAEDIKAEPVLVFQKAHTPNTSAARQKAEELVKKHRKR